MGTDVAPRAQSNGVVSQKGIVIQGVYGEQIHGIDGFGCDYWEIGGVDFLETGVAIWTFRDDNQNVDDSSDHWYIHNNRVYNYYRESGIQLNGSQNLVENNEIYKVSNELFTPFSCQLLNILGFGNTIRNNKLSRLGSTANCEGLLFEWDLSDNNLVEGNQFTDVMNGVDFEGGDNNIIRNNAITAATGTTRGGIEIASYDNRTTWPCNDWSLTVTTNEYYPYLSNPHNCHSQSNQIYSNTIAGFGRGVVSYPIVDASNIIGANTITP